MCLHDFNWITDPFLEGLFSLTLKKTSPKDYPVAIHKVQISLSTDETPSKPSPGGMVGGMFDRGNFVLIRPFFTPWCACNRLWLQGPYER